MLILYLFIFTFLFCDFLYFIFFFFFNDPATTEIYTVYNTLSLHDALPIWTPKAPTPPAPTNTARSPATRSEEHTSELQSLYTISYAVFCLKKKKKKRITKTFKLTHLTKKAYKNTTRE